MANTEPKSSPFPLQSLVTYLRTIHLRNLLSFGPDSPAVELGPLNVLIGPNGSGKSNLIEALNLLRSTPLNPQQETGRDFGSTLLRGGGPKAWIWNQGNDATASIEIVASAFEDAARLRHRLTFRGFESNALMDSEWIELSGPQSLPAVRPDGWTHDYNSPSTFTYMVYDSAKASQSRWMHELSSILSRPRDPEGAKEELEALGRYYESWRIYQGWSIGRSNVLRDPQRADAPKHRIAEDYSNLAVRLNQFDRDPALRSRIVEMLRKLYPRLTDCRTIVDGGTVQLHFEEGSRVVPATRVSDGTLRYLALLAILLDPKPAPLICLEEPEIGLHPDILPDMAELLTDASTRTQLIVTTHSDTLVDALGRYPESILVCENENGQTTFRRLDQERLQEWLKDYSGLGELWSRGFLGGNRW